MTNEELILAFPECERVKRDDMRQCIIEAMEHERFYRVASNKVYKKANDLWPYKREWRDKNPEYEAYKLYFWNDWPRKSPFNEWQQKLEDEFIERHGQVHTFEEACQLAADEWVRMIFDHHMQDNGDKSYMGGFTMALGTLVKEKSRRGIGIEFVEKFRTLCRDYYLGGCIYEDKYGKRVKEPYCDYDPNSPLADLLLKAGVPKERVGGICPWKTGITINERDNSVIIRGYQTERFI